MGNGEVFYGKRKYKPSGKVENSYSGYGLSDKGKIDAVREYKRMREEEKKKENNERQLSKKKLYAKRNVGIR